MTFSCSKSICCGRSLAVVLLLAAATHSEADDAEPEWSAAIGVASDYTFRGVSQTMERHSIQASVELSLPSGLYAYAWGSNVDFIPDNEPDDGATHEIDLAFGFARELSEDWSVDVALVRYLFPGTIDDIDYDYNELLAALWYDGTYSATIGFSSNVDGTGRDSFLYKLGARIDLPYEMGLDVHYGYHDLSDAYGSSYSYAEAALGRSIDNMSFAVAYIDTQNSAELIYGNRVTGPRLVVSLEVAW